MCSELYEDTVGVASATLYNSIHAPTRACLQYVCMFHCVIRLDMCVLAEDMCFIAQYPRWPHRFWCAGFPWARKVTPFHGDSVLCY
jgi:hypothetical protein